MAILVATVYVFALGLTASRIVELAAIVLAAELIILLKRKDWAAAEVTAVMMAAGGWRLAARAYCWATAMCALDWQVWQTYLQCCVHDTP